MRGARLARSSSRQSSNPRNPCGAAPRAFDANPGACGRDPVLNSLLTNLAPTIGWEDRSPLSRPGPGQGPSLKGMQHGFRGTFYQNPGNPRRDQVAHALGRHPLCRSVQFDIVGMPRTRNGGNWTISLQSVAPDALWEASDIVADIQDAYDLAAAA